MMTAPKLLTFNFHEPYLCLLAKTGLPITVGQFDKEGYRREWHTTFRPIPKNITIVEESQWRRDLAQGRFDVVLAHNEYNAADIAPQVVESRTPALMLLHNRRHYVETTNKRLSPQHYEKHGQLVDKVAQIFSLIFISETKRRDYRLPGKVILPGIDVESYGGYRGERAAVLRVGNMMRARDIMFDVDFQEAVCAGFPNRVMGDDPQIPAAKPSASYEDLLEAYRAHRMLLHVSREEFEDGYNLATLEAMACGMPVVTLSNPTSPIRDGVNGYSSYEVDVLRARVAALLADLDQARALGEAGRETVARDFPIARFVEQWQAAIEEAAESSPLHTGQQQAVRPMKILMDYVASPVTTARYLENALRKRHFVHTTGFRVPEDVLYNWGFPSPAPTYLAQQIETPLEPDAIAINDALPRTYDPQIYLWVDSGLKKLPSNFDRIRGTKVCYLVDTHLAPDLRIELAKEFDHVFLAQKGQVELFRSQGVRAHWLPLAASPELHRWGLRDRDLDVAYVGRISDDPDDRRSKLIESIRERFPNAFIGQVWPEEMARVYGRAKIVINAAANRDVNMRVFEAMAAGALLITDDADGLDELFEDGVHYVRYTDDAALPQLVAQYLADESSRLKIAEAGRATVMALHTYDHRMEEMLRMVSEDSGTYGGFIGESRYEQGGYYRNTRSELLPFIPKEAERVLDCGCGGGDFGRQLKERGVKEVVGIEVVDRAWEIAKKNLDQALLGSIEDMELPFEDEYFDAVTFNDVLEHLVSPIDALKKACAKLKPGGTVVISIPNIRFYEAVKMLAEGRWRYEAAGIMDRTHLRFFTAVELVNLLTEAGLELDSIRPLTIVPESEVPRQPDGSLRLGKITIHDVTDSELVEFRTYQWLAVARKPSGSSLERAQAALDANENERAYELAATAPDGVDRKLVLAKAAARLGKLQESEALYNAVLESEPGNPDANGELGILMLARNRSHAGVAYLEKAVNGAGDNPRYVGALGLAYQAEGRNEEALARLAESLNASIHNEALVPHLLDTAQALGRLDTAEPIMDRFLAFFPGQVDIGCRYAQLLNEAGKVDKARECIETVLLLSPDHEGANSLLAEFVKG